MVKESIHSEFLKISGFNKKPSEETQSLLNLMKTLCALSYEELDAIGREKEMTEDMFIHCLRICIQTDNFHLFEDIWNDFPELNVAVAIEAYEVLKGSELLKTGDIKNKYLNTVLLRIEELYVKTLD